MSLYKRGKTWHTIVVVNGVYHRESLGTTDKREAKSLEHERIEQLKKRALDPSKRGRSYGSLTIASAMKAYIDERRRQVSPRMVAYWQEQERSLSAHFKTLTLKRITAAHIANYQNARLDANKAPKTINGELSVLRQLLKHARLWLRIAEDYKPIKNTKPPVGRALSLAELKCLFETAALWKSESAEMVKVGKDGKTYKTHPDWQYAHAAATLAAFCGLRACEIKALQWKDVDFAAGLLDIRRSKTPGGWRTPTLNSVCSEVLADLFESARLINATDPEHFVFPWQGGKGRRGKERTRTVDPTRPMAGWRSAWRSILKEAGIKARFHDLRHTAVTTMAEAGLPDLTIMAQVGHVDPAMMKTYSHIRRQALNAAAAALQPTYQQSVSTQTERVN